MKPGQLVMLVKHPPTIKATTPPKGSIGEVVQLPEDKAIHLKMACVAVEFPGHPSEVKSGLWEVPVEYLIPITDPDADVEQEDKAPVKEKELTD